MADINEVLTVQAKQEILIHSVLVSDGAERKGSDGARREEGADEWRFKWMSNFPPRTDTLDIKRYGENHPVVDSEHRSEMHASKYRRSGKFLRPLFHMSRKIFVENMKKEEEEKAYSGTGGSGK